MRASISFLLYFWITEMMLYNLFGQNTPLPLYKNSQLSVEERVEDLLSRMTLEEKVGQLLCPMGWEMYEKQESKIECSEKFRQLIEKYHIGMFWAVYRADPWTKKTIENGLNPSLATDVGNTLQRYVLENTRLGIPLFIAEEAPHGHMAIGTTVFPVGIALASSWNPSLVEKVASVISKEVRLQGGHISYGPVLDLARDPRWSRVEEGYGEDPVLSGALGAAYARGTGGGNLKQPYSTISTIKHFVAYGIPQGGHNGNPAIIGERELLSDFLPPFKSTIDAGALSIMTAYNSIDGIPCTANKYLLQDILHDQWDFKGFVVSDLVSIDGLAESHFVAGSIEEAGVMALDAGVDIDLGANAFKGLIAAVKKGMVAEETVDRAAYRVLRLKFAMGLFENPYVDPKEAQAQVRKEEHVRLAREAAQQSIVILENKHHTLPLSRNLKRISVIGPNADNHYNQLGDYTAPQNREAIITVLDGIKAKMSHAEIEYVKGCAIRDTSWLEIKKAAEAAKRADVAIVVVGGSSARDFKSQYVETGAAIVSSETLGDIESGEGYDRSTLDLLGKQLDLLKAVRDTGTPMVVIYIQGRPLDMNWVSEQADALLTAWYPGQEGGHAIADVLWGDASSFGRLPISVPRSVAQTPVYYNKKNPRGHDYVEMTANPLYPFGYGLTYTRFEYENLQITCKGETDFEISFDLLNSGDQEGDEVVQLYIRDEIASVVQPIKQLKQFKRVPLKRGGIARVSFEITATDLAIVNCDMEWTVEPGTFSVMIGASSEDIRLNGHIEVK